MTPLAAKVIWLIGVVGWFIIRYPHARRARRTPKHRRSDRGREFVLLAISATGLGIVPVIYVFTGAPRFATYPMQPWQGCWVRRCSQPRCGCSIGRTRISDATGR